MWRPHVCYVCKRSVCGGDEPQPVAHLSHKLQCARQSLKIMVSYGNKYPRHNARPHVVEQSGQCARALIAMFWCASFCYLKPLFCYLKPLFCYLKPLFCHNWKGQLEGLPSQWQYYSLSIPIKIIDKSAIRLGVFEFLLYFNWVIKEIFGCVYISVSYELQNSKSKLSTVYFLYTFPWVESIPTCLSKVNKSMIFIICCMI